jgi:uncharacterized protein
MSTSNEKNTAALIHLSTLTQYFIPFGNYIFPILLWSSRKNESEFVDSNGKQVLNFQLSMFLYTLILLLVSIPILIFTVLKNITFSEVFNRHDFVIENFNHSNLTGIVVLAITAIILFGFLKIIEFILIIYGAVKASNGENYKYPLSISFFK